MCWFPLRLLRTIVPSVCLLLVAADHARAQSTLIPLTTRRGMVFDFSGNWLYIATSDGLVRSYNLTSGTFGTDYNLGGTLNGIDIARDNSFLLVAQGTAGISQGTFQKIDLQTGDISNINFQLVNQENGAWDVALCSNGIALVTTRIPDHASEWDPLRQIDLKTNAISIRTDAPGSGGGGSVREQTKLQRSADGSRCYLLEPNASNGPMFTFDATTNTFGAAIQTYAFLDQAGAGVNRDGTILGTLLPDYPDFGENNTSLDTAANFGFLHAFNAMNAGVAFDGMKDIFYTIGSGGTQIFAFDTNTFRELFRFNIGETISGNVIPFSTGTLVASPDGHYLALETPSGIRLFTLPKVAPTPTPSPTPTFSNPRDMVFNHAGTYLYITSASGLVWPYNLLTDELDAPYDLGGTLNGLDIAPDDSFLLVAQGSTGVHQGAFQKVNLATGVTTNFTYTLAFSEVGGWDVAVASNGTAFTTTDFTGSGWVPLRQLDLANGTFSIRTDAPGSGGGGQIRNHSQVQRSADRTRLYFLESDISSGPVFTYSTASDTFSSSAHTNTFLDFASASVNRDGSLLGTRLSGNSTASLDSAANFNFVRSFNGLDSGVAFDAVKDIFYGVNSSTDQIFGYATNNFVQKVLLQIGENVSAGSSQFGPGTLVASQDGRYLALQTTGGIHVFAIPPASGPAVQVTSIARRHNGHMLVQGFAAPNSTNTVKATSNLTNGFMGIGSVMADANGAFQFEDVNTGTFTTRLYQITSP